MSDIKGFHMSPEKFRKQGRAWQQIQETAGRLEKEPG